LKTKQITSVQILFLQVFLILSFGLVSIFIIIPRISEINELKGSENYEYGIVARMSHGKRNVFAKSVYFISETDNPNKKWTSKCEINVFGPFSKYSIGDREKIIFNDSRSFCILYDYKGELLFLRILLGICLAGLFVGIFMRRIPLFWIARS